MLTTLLVALLSQTPAPSAPHGVVVLVSQRTGVTPERSLQLAKDVSEALAKNGVAITHAPAAAQEELAPLMKDTTACEGNRKCLAKLATLLRARAVIGVDVAEVMKETAVHLEMISEDGTRLAEHNLALPANDKTPMATHLRAFSAGVVASLPVPVAVTPKQDAPTVPAIAPPAPQERIVYLERPAPPMKRWAWAPIALGTAGLASGATLMVAASNRHDSLLNDPQSVPTALRSAEEGKRYQTLGFIGLGVGTAALAGGVAMMLLGGEEGPGGVSVSPTASESGAGVSVGGTLP